MKTVIIAAFGAVLASGYLMVSAPVASACVPGYWANTQYNPWNPPGPANQPCVPDTLDQQPAQQQAPPSGGDDQGGRCDWAMQIGWSQFAQCKVHIGPQTQDEYRRQQDNVNCHRLYGPDPNHYSCPG
jgi:hypothetical protein